MKQLSCAAVAPQGTAAQSWFNRLINAFLRWRAARRNRRIQQAAISRLWSMTDRELKDIGLTRSEIVQAVKIDGARGRAFRRYS